jgi:hypothetical protein
LFLKKKVDRPLFEVLAKDQTNLDFSNNLTYTPEFNLFKYMYFYNGSGIGAGDLTMMERLTCSSDLIRVKIDCI